MTLLDVKSLRLNGAAAATARATWLWRVVAVLLIGALLAHWVWVLFAPPSASVRPAAPTAAGAKAELLFGVAAVTTPAPQVAVPNVRLIGVFAGKPGFAVLELDGGRQVGLASGGEIAPGAKLVEVASDHVVIERGGVRQQIQLERKKPATDGVVGVPVQPQSGVTAAPPAATNAAVSASGYVTSQQN